MKYKPEGTEERGGGTRAGSTSKAAITSQMQMSLDEAHLILNVKKDEPLDVIIRVCSDAFHIAHFNANIPSINDTILHIEADLLL
jgi:hypothetical protein